MAGLAAERQNKIRKQKEDLRTLALTTKDYQSFELASESLVKSIDVFDLLDEFTSQGCNSLQTYYKNIGGK